MTTRGLMTTRITRTRGEHCGRGRFALRRGRRRAAGSWLSQAGARLRDKRPPGGCLFNAYHLRTSPTPCHAGAVTGAEASAPTGARGAGEGAGAAAGPRAAGAATRSRATAPVAAQGRGLLRTIAGKGAGAAAAFPRARGPGVPSGRLAGGLWRVEGTRMRRLRRCWAWALAQM